MMSMDRETSSIVITRSDGMEARFPLESASPFAETSVLSSLHFTPALDRLLAVTRAGDEIVFELPKLGDNDRLAGQLVVYLDQNQWSAIAKARLEQDGVRQVDTEAVRQLFKWVNESRIILPAASGHYFETTKRYDAAKRYSLGLTILQLSGGWQMRDPLQVRRDELRSALSCRYMGSDGPPRAADVFSLEPNVIHGPMRGGAPHEALRGFPPEAALGHEALTSATALIDVMLDLERIEPGRDAGWSAANQRFSDWLDSADRDSQQKRQSIDVFLLSDMGTEIAEEAVAAGLTAEQVNDWMMKYAASDIRQLPALGLFREMLHERHLNKGTTWRPNDLTDMLYLSCAAGYADVVVCERHMSSMMRQGIKRLDRSVRVYPRLREAEPGIRLEFDYQSPR